MQVERARSPIPLLSSLLSSAACPLHPRRTGSGLRDANRADQLAEVARPDCVEAHSKPRARLRRVNDESGARPTPIGRDEDR